MIHSSNFLVSLPTSLVRNILSQWLKQDSLPRLDFAFCIHQDRHRFLELLDQLVLEDACITNDGHDFLYKLKWMVARNVKCISFKFRFGVLLQEEEVGLDAFLQNSESSLKNIVLYNNFATVGCLLLLIAQRKFLLTRLSVNVTLGAMFTHHWYPELEIILHSSSKVLQEFRAKSWGNWKFNFVETIQLPALRVLYIDIHCDEDLITICRAAPNLIDITLCNNPQCSQVGLGSIGQFCRKLSSLVIMGTVDIINLDDAMGEIVKSCRNLSHLQLDVCPNLTDIGLTAIAKYCAQLVELTITNNDYITDSSLITLAHAESSHLLSLNLDGCRTITGAGIVAISTHCTVLRKLNLAYMSGLLTENLLIALPNLARLQSLTLTEFQVSDDRVMERLRSVWGELDGLLSITGHQDEQFHFYNTEDSCV